MIRISRGSEPVALRDERYFRLARAELAWRQDEPIDFSGYEVAKDSLWKAQNYKCAFCEMTCVTEGQPVEHYRPKGKAIRSDGRQDAGYWWLAWNWRNLLFACVTCNSAYKKDHFPLVNDDDALDPLAAPPGNESPQLVDPASEDPLDHLQFVEIQEGRWIPVPRAGSERGRQSIEITGIGSTTHLTLYRDFVTRGAVPRLLGAVADAIGVGDRRLVRESWQTLLDELFFGTAQFQALAYCAVDSRFPAKVRAQWGLVLPRPGDPTPSPKPTDRQNPHLAGLPPELALRCRALGQRASRGILRALLRDLCVDTPRTPGELADFIEREVGTVDRHLQALLADRQVMRLPNGRYNGT